MQETFSGKGDFFIHGRVRAFEFAPTLYRVRPRNFRVRPHQVEFAPRLSHV